jgi:hypothetical protein
LEKEMIKQHLSIDEMKDSMRAPWIAGDFGAIGSTNANALLSFGLVANLTTQMIFAAILHEITADWTWSGA